MTVALTSCRNDWVGNGAVPSYIFTFPIVAPTDLAVYYFNPATGYGGRLVQGVGYPTPMAPTTDGLVNLAANINDAGGNVVTDSNSFLANGILLTMLRVQPLVQSLSISNNGTTYPNVLEVAGFDALLLKIQQLEEQISRALTLAPQVSPTNFSPFFQPGITAAPNQLLAVNANGNGVVTVSGPGRNGSVNLLLDGVNYQATVSDDLILGSASGGPQTVTLPDATTCKGHRIEVLKSVGGHNITVATLLAQTINTGGSVTISSLYSFVTFESDGSNWWKV